MAREGKLYMATPTPAHNHYGLKLWGRPELVERFNEICWREFSPRCITEPEKAEERRAWGAFWQSQAESGRRSGRRRKRSRVNWASPSLSAANSVRTYFFLAHEF